MADQVTLDPATFRALFPEFAAQTDEALQIRWDNEATAYVSADNCGDLTGTKRAYAVQLMLAHLLRLSAMAVENPSGPAGVVTAATIDKVSVTQAPPPVSAGDAWGHWLQQTPYGGQLAAYLKRQAVGGFYVGGHPERAAFRKAGGVF
jgi:hypothetical protein